MIRPLTFFCVVLAGTSGLYLYTEKHQTTVLDQKISKVVQDTQQIRERTAMLRAEWALLNQPDRLQSLATRFLPQLHPLDPGQFVQLASVERRLPAVVQPASPAPVQPFELTPVQVMARVMAPSGPATLSDTPAAPDIRTAEAEPAPEQPVQHQAAAVAPAHRLATPHAARAVAVAAAQHPAHAAMVAHATPRTVRTTPMVQMAAYSAPPLRRLIPVAGPSHPAPLPIAAWRPAQRYASVQRTQTAYSGYQSGGSSLGFSHAALPPPVPVQDGN